MVAMATLSETLRERGYTYQFSSETLEEITDGPKRTLYLGIDPTADSMHVGQLMSFLVLRRFVEAGHKLIIIVGGGTGMIGDPGGRSSERNLLDDVTLAKNTEALKKQITTLVGRTDFLMVNNADWLKHLSLIDFLRDVGKHFTVNEMIKRDSVRPRLETPDSSISFTEFSYMLLQAYDFYYLHKEYGCDLQVGGSDQWGNIVSGIDFIRKKTSNTAYAFSWPLVVDKKTGKKFGKSEGGAVWLDSAKTAPFQFYQFWFNIDDDMVEEMLLKMTVLSHEEITTVTQTHAANPGAREAQKLLARSVTELVHGVDAAVRSEIASHALFGDIAALTKESVEMLTQGLPTTPAVPGIAVVDVLVSSGLASSKREAREFLEKGAIVVNGAKIEDRTLIEDDFVHGIAIMKRGKREARVIVRS
ncbi:tyrosine--tRNA ligase [bacterium]|nr:tyrosine--tRNA ligase [bacterium]